MSSSIDERVVGMRFENGQFESGIRKSIGSLAGLKAALSFGKNAKELDNLSEAGRRFSLGPVGAAAEGISTKFVAMATIGITALTNIVNKAMAAGEQIMRSLTIDPIKAGFDEYELKMGSIQTILSNTSKAGTTLEQVTASLDELNTYADKTIYNFGDMTKNIGLFTNAGIGIEDATAMIKGFSNEAAASGTSAEGSAGAAYQLSQALSAGTIRLMDWRSLTNVGMGNKNMQNGIIEIAEAMGEFEGTTITAADAAADFNGSLEKNWLSADVMTNYLKIQAGELSDEQMRALNLTDDQITAFRKQQTIAEEAATKVRTWTQLLGTLQEGVGSAWSETFDILIGDFDQATALWTSVNDALGPMIGASGEARNAMLQAWSDLGGRDVAIEGIKNAFTALMSIVTPIKDAFREIFPATTGQQLYDLTVKIRDFTSRLTVSSETADKIKRIFKGAFAVLDIGKSIVGGLFSVLGRLFGELTKGTGGVLDFAAGIGDFLVELNQAVKEGEGFNKFFEKMGDILVTPIALIKALAGWISDLFGDATTAGADATASTFEKLQTRLEPVGKLAESVSGIWKKMGDVAKKVWEFMKPIGEAIGDFFIELGNTISESVQSMDFDQILDMVNTGLLGGLVLMLKKFLGGGINVDVGGGLLDTIRESFGGLTDTMSAMQAQLKSGTLLKIAGAIALLTVSVIALSLIDSKKLATALGAMTIMFMQLLGAMAIFEKITASGAFLKMPFAAAAMILLSTAIVILTVAVRNLSGLDWQELAKGLAGVTALLGALAGTAKLMSSSSKGLISAGIGMIAVAVAIKLLVSSVKDFAEMDWADLGKGLAGVGAALAALGIFTRLAALNKAGLAQSAGLILVAVSLKLIAGVVKEFAGMEWEELGKGFAALAVALGLIVGAMILIPPNIAVTAASLVVVAGALMILTQVLQQMGGMTWEEIAKGLVTLAGALVIIAGAMYLMVGALPGAAAMLIVSAALAIFVPVLIQLGNMSWGEIGKGLLALAAAFAVLGVAALVLTPVLPQMLLLGVAVGLIGAGLALAGVGVLAFSVGLTALSIAGAAGTTAIVAMAGAIIGLIPTAMSALANGIVAFAKVIGDSIPVFVEAMVKLIMGLLTAIDTVAPKVIDTLMNLVNKLLDALVENVPKFVDKGMQIIQGFLQGIANNIGNVVTTALNIVTNFINGISQGIPALVESAVNLIVTFLESLAVSIENNMWRITNAVNKIAKAIIDGMVNGIKNGASNVANAVKDLAGSALDTAKGWLGINSPSKEFHKIGAWSSEGMALGITAKEKLVKLAAVKVSRKALDTMKEGMKDLAKITPDMDVQPVIRPVLDLENVRKDANLLKKYVGQEQTMSIAANRRKADSISAEREAIETDRKLAVEMQHARQGDVVYQQTITSPKTLNATEIYRQTKNLVSTAKGAPKK